MASVHVYVSTVRKFLARPGQVQSPVLTRSPGYVLRLGGDEVDVDLFMRNLERGRHLARADRHAEAASCFDDALRGWHDPVLGGLRGGPVIDGFVTWISEARMECTELLMESQLHLGRHRELVGPLSSLAAEYPLREAFHRQLMLALYRSERKADALRAYQSPRRILHDELGLEPYRALRELQRGILTADARLDLLALREDFAASGAAA